MSKHSDDRIDQTPSTSAGTSGDTVLTVQNLKVTFTTENGAVRAVDDVSYALRRGEVLAIVGESGSGKSVSAMTLMGLIRSQNTQISGSATLADGTELVGSSERALRSIRGNRISMIFQDPMSALTPVYRIGEHIVEQIRAHERVSKQAANARAIELLTRVGIPNAKQRARAYPHQFSGGMRQRVMIAMALSCNPEILIADEPTTALDVTIQSQILSEIEDLRKETGVAVLLITHDLGVVAEVADRVLVMYAGRVVEQARVAEAFQDPTHPYTWGLMGSIPRLDRDRPDRLPTISGSPPSLLDPPQGCHFRPRCPHSFDRCTETPELAPVTSSDHQDRCHLDLTAKRSLRLVDGSIGLPVPDGAAAESTGASLSTPDEARGDATAATDQPVLELTHLKVLFPVRSGAFGGTAGHVRAVDDVTLSLAPGETLGLVGESGCGKTTLARTIVRLNDPDEGAIVFRGTDITTKRNRDLAPFRRDVQMVFQDPQSSLNPRKRVSQIIGDGLQLRRSGDVTVQQLLERVGLDPTHAQRYPHEFSGGQRQRIGIARALAADPRLIILDEPVSALDVSIQAQIVNLLDDLQDDLGLSYIFVAHDLSVVRHVSDRIAVMYLGKIVELSAADDLYDRPMHPYTASLLDAIPIPDPDRRHRAERRSVGELPSPINPPSGCRFHTRCPFATEICSAAEPPLAEFGNHLVACHHPLNATPDQMSTASRSDSSPLGAAMELTLSQAQAHEVAVADIVDASPAGPISTADVQTNL